MQTLLMKTLAPFTLALALAGCASGPDIRTDYDPQVDFSAHETFGWVPELGTDRAGYATLTTNYFKEAVRREMEALGYTYDAQDPDLLVNFFARIRDRTETYSRPDPIHTLAPHPVYFHGAGYYGYRYGLYTAWPYYGRDIETVHYKVGTANVDLIDADRQQLIWEGVAEERLTSDELEQPRQAIFEAVGEMFAEFPARRNATRRN